MNSTGKHIQALERYKDYAESTQTLNEALNKQIKDCYHQIDQLRVQLRLLEDQKTPLIANESLKFSTMQSQLNQCGDELHKAKIEVMSLQAQLETERNRNSSKQRLIQDRQDEIDRLKTQIRELESSRWQSHHKIQTLAMELERQTTLSASYQQLLEKRITQISDMQMEAELQIHSKSVIEEEEFAKIEHAYKQKCHQLQLENEQLEANLAKINKDYEWVRNLLAQKGNKEQNLLRQLTESNQERQQIQTQLRHTTDELLQVKSQNDQLKIQLQFLKADIRQREENIMTERDSTGNLTQQVYELKARNKALQEEVMIHRSAKNLKIEELNNKIEQMNTMIMQEKKAAQYRGSQLSDQNSHLFSLVSETSFNSVKEVQRSREEILRLAKQNDKLRDEHSKLLKQLQLKNSIISDLEDRMAKQTSRHQNEDSKQKQLQEELRKTKATLNLSTKDVVDLRNNNKKLQQTVQRLTEDKQELASKLSKMSMGDPSSFGQLPLIPTSPLIQSTFIDKTDINNLHAQYVEVLAQNNLLLQDNDKLTKKKKELLNELEEVRMQISSHSDSHDMMQDLKDRLRDAYQQVQLLKRLKEPEKRDPDRRQENERYRSPANIAQYKSPFRTDPRRERSPVNKLFSPQPDNYWVDIQNKIKNLKSENDQLRRNLTMNSPPRRP